MIRALIGQAQADISSLSVDLASLRSHHIHLSTTCSTIVDAAATRTSGLFSTAVRLFALAPGGRDAMVLRTYER